MSARNYGSLLDDNDDDHPEAEAGPSEISSRAQPARTLAVEAQKLLLAANERVSQDLRTSDSGDHGDDYRPEAARRDNHALIGTEKMLSGMELSVTLYALHLLQNGYTFCVSGVGGSSGSVSPSKDRGPRTRLREERRVSRVRSILERRVYTLLDGEAKQGSSITQAQSQVHTRLLGDSAAGTATLPSDEEDPKNKDSRADEEAMEMLWRPWAVDGKRFACSIDLLLPPYTSRSPFLAHPLIRHALASAWHDGLPPHPSEVEETVDRLHFAQRSKFPHRAFRYLRRSITPRRIHMFHLLSYVILCALCTYVALNPGRWVTPYQPEDDPLGWGVALSGSESGRDGMEALREHGQGGARGRPHLAELLAGIWIVADFWSAFHFRPPLSRLALLSPLYLAVLTDYFSRQLTFALLTTSLPLLYTLLVLPYYPSIPLLFVRRPSALPGDPTVVSQVLSLSCVLSTTLGRFIRPFALLLPLILALLAMFSYSMNGDIWRLIYIPPPSTSVKPTGDGKRLLTPMEPGVAPFQTRLALLVALVLFLLYGIILGVGRARARTRASSPLLNRYDEPDPWERKYGPDASLLARKRFAQAVIFGLGKIRGPSKTPSSNRNQQAKSVSTSYGTPDPERNRNRPMTQNEAERASLIPSGSREGLNRLSHTPYRTLDPFIACPVPLNQIFDILEIVQYTTKGLGKFGGRFEDLSRISAEKIDRLGEWIAVGIMGPLCLILVPLELVMDWVSDRLYSYSR